MKPIFLSQQGKNKDKYVAWVDDKDYISLNYFRWCFDGKYAQRRGKGKTIRMHSVLMQPPKGLEVDHLNGNPLDNRRSNLRICTHKQNCQNLKLKRLKMDEPLSSSNKL